MLLLLLLDAANATVCDGCQQLRPLLMFTLVVELANRLLFCTIYSVLCVYAAGVYLLRLATRLGYVCGMRLEDGALRFRCFGDAEHRSHNAEKPVFQTRTERATATRRETVSVNRCCVCLLRCSSDFDSRMQRRRR